MDGRARMRVFGPSGEPIVPGHPVASPNEVLEILETWFPCQSRVTEILRTPATERIFARFDEGDVERILDAITSALGSEKADEIGELREQNPAGFRRKIIQYGNALLADEMNAKTGVIHTPPPPDDVPCFGVTDHWCGDLYFCDMITEAIEDAGLPVREGGRYLDFGCMSGRVVRTMAAAFPEAEWHGCDPQKVAIDWAAANLPTVRFYVNDVKPPLPKDDATYSGVFAMSVWSHYSAAAAKWWFDEMYRVIEPGGWLLFSSHSLAGVRKIHVNRKKSAPRIHDILNSLINEGFAFDDCLHGTRNFESSEWGNAFMLPIWVMKTVFDKWDLSFYRIGMYNSNQDLYVLRRRPD
jgi:SAM-dependent methyltransferase